MNKIFFALGLLLASNAFAATGTGEAQAELTNPLSITTGPVKFGTVAIDIASGPQTYNLGGACPSGYVCTGTSSWGSLTVNGAPNTEINLSLEGATAVLSDGNGNTISFDPLLSTGTDAWVLTLSAAGVAGFLIGGALSFTGNEVGGNYNTTNTGGSGYVATVNY